MKIFDWRFFSLTILITGVLFCCQKGPELPDIDLSSYQLENGFQLEAVCSEPLIQAPVDIDFDLQGRIWALELPGYMANIEGQGEEDPSGRILILEDKDGDGRAETTKVFLDRLVAPRALALVYDGLLYAEPPNLWFVEIEEDQPGKKTLVDSTYAVGGNIEHQPNGLVYNTDNWIYSAKSDVRYRRINEEWIKENTYFRGQWGISHDHYGRLFYNDNSTLLRGDHLPPNLLTRNPYLDIEKGMGKPIVKSQRVYPLHATSVNRGYIEGVLDEEGKLNNTTSACGPVIYESSHFPDEYQYNAFVCVPEANLLKRLILKREDGRVKGKQAWQGKEFLASTDEAFRPVNLKVGPGGYLYIVDMHRGIIQHQVYMTSYLREQLLKKDLDDVVHFGRILRVKHQEGNDSNLPDLEEEPIENLVLYLGSPDSWYRHKVQQFIINRKPKGIVDELIRAIDKDIMLLTSLKALWCLEGLDALEYELLEQVALHDDPELSSTAIRLMTEIEDPDPGRGLVKAIFRKDQPLPDMNLALLLGRVGRSQDIQAFHWLFQLAQRHDGDTLFSEVVVAALDDQEKAFLGYLSTNGGMLLSPLVGMLEATIRNKEVKATDTAFLQEATKGFDKLTRGLEWYQLHCGTCHGPAGKGIDNIAPPLYGSEYVSGPVERLILITLHGLKGPVHVKGKKYELNSVMPGLAANPTISNEEIAAILTFIRNGFSDTPYDVKPEQVDSLRSVKPQMAEMFTEEELLKMNLE